MEETFRLGCTVSQRTASPASKLSCRGNRPNSDGAEQRMGRRVKASTLHVEMTFTPTSPDHGRARSKFRMMRPPLL